MSFFKDPSIYCKRIFNTFDQRKTGKITFEVTSYITIPSFAAEQNLKFIISLIYYKDEIFYSSKQEFVIGLSNCLHSNNERKLRWAFRIYDDEEKGFLYKEVRNMPCAITSKYENVTQNLFINLNLFTVAA